MALKGLGVGRFCAGAVAAVAASVAVGGCGERTQIVVVSGTDLPVPQQVDRVEIEVTGPGDTSRQATADLQRTEPPAVLGLVHRGGPRGPLEVRVVGRRGSEEVVTRRARTSFVSGRTLMLRMDLLSSCVGVSCGDAKTCTSDGCAELDVDPEALPEWNGPPASLDASATRDGGMDGAVVDAGRDGSPQPSDAGRDGNVTDDAAEPECSEAGDCNDGVACTLDDCVDGRCMHEPDDSFCVDGLACTMEYCDPSAGCRRSPDDASCDDGAECTVDECDPEEGCVNTPDDTACDDGIDCTVDSCGEAGCVFEPDHRICEPGQLCDPDGGGCVPAPDFTTLYDTLLAAECSNCHTSEPFRGDLDMSTRDKAYADLVEVPAVCGEGNILVIPYDAAASLLWRKIAEVDLCGDRMPRGRGKLSSDDIDAVADWINAGAADN